MEQQQPRGRGRGRARGRARESAAPQQPGPSTQAPPPTRPAWGPPPGGPATTGATPKVQQPPVPGWGPKPQMQQQHQIRAPAPPMQPPATYGRAMHRPGSDVAKAPGGDGGAGGDMGANRPSLRGSLRGRRPISDVMTYFRTKPLEIQSKRGTHGQKVTLYSNYFKLEQQTDWTLCQYRVDFSPEEDQTMVRKRLVRTALKETLPAYVFDGTVLYSTHHLTPDPFEIFVDNEEQKTRITIRLVGQLGDGDYHFLQFFNIIVRKCMGFLKLQLVGRNFFDAAAKISIPNIRMELWPGYLTSIRQHENSILMCCEVATKVMRVDTVSSLLKECMQEDRSGYKKLFEAGIVGTIVLTDYNNRTYHIDAVDWDSTPASEFKRADGSSLSYERYFQERYNLFIRDKRQPMLVSCPKKREIRSGMSDHIYLVPELCRLTGLSAAQRANFSLMRTLAEHTRVNPESRITKLQRFSERLRKNPEIMAELRSWNMKLAADLVEFDARVLPPEVVLCGQSGSYSAGKDAGWTREVRSKAMFSEGKCQEWAIIFPDRLKQSVDKFANCIGKCAQGMRWNIPRAKFYELREDRIHSYLEMLEQVMSKGNPSLILCVVPNNKSDRYAAIKKKCSVDRAVPTQVLVARNVEARDPMSIATKVAIQMNCKLGGSPWSLQIPLSNIMVCGFDVCHDPHDKTKSYGALVCSLDKQYTRYFSCTQAHSSGEEISKDFALYVIKGCKAWRQWNKVLPERILIYRDGVGDGQIPFVKEHEVENMKKLLADQLYGETPFKLCFIVVSKRINTRFFLGRDNPPPGTVVDSCVTLPERYDFFIVSQCVTKGTVSPTSYNVISDNMGLSPDHLQRLTYKLTHMYFNWSGTVRVPAPCQYAHKLAFLVSQSLRKEPHHGLSTTLYFL